MNIFIVNSLLLIIIWFVLSIINIHKPADCSSFFCRNHTELLRGYAIFSILFSHVANLAGVNAMEYPSAVGVSLFLLLSGYGIAESYQKNGFRCFWRKRFVRIYVPYIFGELIFIGLTNAGLDFGRIVLDLSLIKPWHYFGWYLRFAMACYIMFWFVFKFTKKPEHKVIAISAIMVVYFIVRGTVWKDNTPFLQARQVMAFPLGILLAYKMPEKLRGGVQQKNDIIVFNLHNHCIDCFIRIMPYRADQYQQCAIATI